ncbi:hypothetical protein BDQ17DRAFT_1334004 [Cyathus striatus]|nr:hypothetical protein BDQ17DRAFT_1334004 [Cyathus striatus]
MIHILGKSLRSIVSSVTVDLPTLAGRIQTLLDTINVSLHAMDFIHASCPTTPYPEGRTSRLVPEQAAPSLLYSPLNHVHMTPYQRCRTVAQAQCIWVPSKVLTVHTPPLMVDPTYSLDHYILLARLICGIDPGAVVIGITGESHSARGACWKKVTIRDRVVEEQDEGLPTPVTSASTSSFAESSRSIDVVSTSRVTVLCKVVVACSVDDAEGFDTEDDVLSLLFGVRPSLLLELDETGWASTALFPHSYENFLPPASMLSGLEHYNYLVTEEAEKYINVMKKSRLLVVLPLGANSSDSQAQFGGTTVISMRLEDLDKSRCVVGGELGIPTNPQSAFDLVKVDLGGDGCSPPVAACTQMRKISAVQREITPISASPNKHICLRCLIGHQSRIVGVATALCPPIWGGGSRYHGENWWDLTQYCAPYSVEGSFSVELPDDVDGADDEVIIAGIDDTSHENYVDKENETGTTPFDSSLRALQDMFARVTGRVCNQLPSHLLRHWHQPEPISRQGARETVATTALSAEGRQKNKKPGVHQAGPSETKRTCQPWHRGRPRSNHKDSFNVGHRSKSMIKATNSITKELQTILSQEHSRSHQAVALSTDAVGPCASSILHPLENPKYGYELVLVARRVENPPSS